MLRAPLQRLGEHQWVEHATATGSLGRQKKLDPARAMLSSATSRASCVQMTSVVRIESAASCAGGVWARFIRTVDEAVLVRAHMLGCQATKDVDRTGSEAGRRGQFGVLFSSNKTTGRPFHLPPLTQLSGVVRMKPVLQSACASLGSACLLGV